ncbi:MAG: hypothetical protein QOG35_1618 [Solirubrobacteraceae bacterium]|nr:hypothetical protein [Solirubrobacteraceae bacterium]
MILPREQIHLILRGQRTLLLVPRGDEPGGAPPYKAGRPIPLQTAATRPATCRVAVLRVTDVALGELDELDARALGVRDVDELRQAWAAEHGRWDAAARAWKLAIALDHAARPHMLVPQSGRHGRRALLGYTTDPAQAMPDEPEAVDEHALAAGRRAAHQTEHDRFEQLLAQRERLDPVERLRLALADARARGTNIDRDLHVIAQRVKAIERRVYRPAERIASS